MTKETFSETFTLPAAGNYDPDVQLGPHQVAAFKQLVELPEFVDTADYIVQQIILDLLVRDELEDYDENPEEAWIDASEAELLRNPKVTERIARAAYLGSHWRMGLEAARGLSTDDQDWPEFLTPPATYSQHLTNEAILGQLANMIKNNPDVDFAKLKELYALVTGVSLDEMIAKMSTHGIEGSDA